MTLTFYEPSVTERDVLVPFAQRAARESGLTRFEFRLLAFMILSFSYEIPLVYITSMYKANPYLYDVASIALILYWLARGRFRGWKMPLQNPMFAPWLVMVGCFAWATLISASWVPFAQYKFSIWYLGMYVHGLLVVTAVLSAPLTEKDKRNLMWVALIGGSWCALVAILQAFEVVGQARVIPKGWEIGIEGKGVISTLGPTYFHVGIVSIITTGIGFVLYQASRGSARFVAGLLAGLCAVPAVICGSRAAFLGLVISVGVLVIANSEYRKNVGMWLMGGVFLIILNGLYASSLTKYRTTGKGEGAYEEEAGHRVTKVWFQVASELKDHPVMFVAGGGFYVVPHQGRWRIGYGVHNLYLLPFEQAGLPALLGSFWWWWRVGTRLGRRRPNRNESPIDVHMRRALFAYFVALLVFGWAGGHFWMKGATEHLNTYLVLMLGLALKETGGSKSPTPTRVGAEGDFGITVPYLKQ